MALLQIFLRFLINCKVKPLYYLSYKCPLSTSKILHFNKLEDQVRPIHYRHLLLPHLNLHH
jgi:hypothetical protein